MSAVCFQNVVKRYPGRAVLRGVDLEVPAGRLVGLAGLNGAGKTSLFKCLLDFCPLDGGRIAIFGERHSQPRARRRLAYLPERFAPPYYLKGKEFLRYMLALRGQAFERAAADQMAAALALDPAALERTVRAYSKGMAQQLGLAACLLAQADLLVLDEPTSGLDPQARALLKDQLQLLRARGAGVLFSSHSLADMDELCDHMAILHGGTIRFVGSPVACRAAYGGDTLERAFLRCVGRKDL